MKKLAFILIISFFCLQTDIVLATNSHSIDLESGSSQFLSITDASQTGLDITGDISIEMWVKLESGAVAAAYTSDMGLCYKAVNNASNMSWKWSLTAGSGSGKVKFQFDFSSDGNVGGTLTRTFDTNDTFVTADEGTWHHIAVTADVSVPTVTFYLDGTARTTNMTNSAATSIFSGSGNVTIGTNGPGDGIFFDGLIDDVRIWDDVRTQQEIQDNDNTELTGSEGNLVAYWKLNNSLLDETTNNNDLTNNNSAVFSTDVPFVGATPVILKEDGLLIFE